jgi:uncharacterized membrane protein YeaQ/YmgE (transglycosylase-associated protein family)
MTLSAYLISLVFATVLGLLFHVIVGGRGWRILFFILCSILGFFLGNLIGGALNWKWLNVGPVHVIPATLGAIGILLLGCWLGKVQKSS